MLGYNIEVKATIHVVPITLEKEEVTTTEIDRPLGPTERIYRCSICGQQGRNARTHPEHCLE